MASLIPGYEYDIFISYRQKDNKGDKWVSEFVNVLKTELESTFKEEISIYFDENPKDGLLETHIVDESLIKKLKCLIFIPVVSQTYCDSNSYAWNHEFCAFNKLAKEDRFGRDITLTNGNLSSRILPVKIHDLEPEDKALLENEIGGYLRSIEFIYKSAGVNRPLRANEEHPQDNINKTYYRDQINKVANAIKEIITSLKKTSQHHEEVTKPDSEAKFSDQKKFKTKVIAGSLILLILVVVGYLFIPKLFNSSRQLEKSIAVLPFENLSSDPEQEYFSDGMVDEILDRLFKIGDLKVIARTSSMRYKNTQLSLKEIAHELGVSTVLEGSVRKIGNKVRITVQLIDAKTEFHLWSNTYDRDISDVFSIQSEVAQNVARELKATLTSKETDLIRNTTPTTNQVAYNFYLKGNNYYLKYLTDSAILMYTQALHEDPLFAGAHVKRARAHLYRYWQKSEGWQGHDLKAREDIKIGLELNPELPELKITEAAAYYHLDRNYDAALKILDKLKSESPNLAEMYPYIAYILRRQGKWNETINNLKYGLQLDPINTRIANELANTYGLMHQYDNQIGIARQGLLLIPDYKGFNNHVFNAYLNKTSDLKMSLNESGLAEEDIQSTIYYYTRQYVKLIELTKKDSTFETSQFLYHPRTYYIAFIYYLSGNPSLCKIHADSAIVHLKEKITEDPNDDRYYATIGKCYALIGNKQEAINCGRKAVDLKPLKLDAWQGVVKEQDLMEIYILTGNYDLALDKIEYLLSIPSHLHKGDLSIDPIYDLLRDLPRFQKILKTEYKIKYQ